MSIADRLIAIAENQQKVYDAGYNKGKSEGGGGSFYDDFWDVFQDYGSRTNYYMTFQAGTMYPNGYWDSSKGTYNPKYTIKCSSGDYAAQKIYSNNAGIKSTMVDIDCSQATKMTQTFYDCPYLTDIPKLILNENIVYSNTFGKTPNLQNITIEGAIGNNIDFTSSTKLSKASIISIINHLSSTAPKESGKTLTLSKTAVNTAFGIDVDDESTFPEGSEYYNLRHSKDNWIFAYA